MRVAQNLTAPRIKAGMDALGIDQSELARRVGCTAAAINQLVGGKTRHSKFLPAIARELRLPVEYLEGTIDSPDAKPEQLQLTSDERAWLDALRNVSAKNKTALLQLARSLPIDRPATRLNNSDATPLRRVHGG